MVQAYVNIQGVEGIPNGDYVAARGSKDVSVNTYSPASLSIDIKGSVDQGRGVFEYDIKLPIGLDSAYLEILTLTGTSQKNINLNYSTSGSFGLDAGYYFLNISRTKSETSSVRTEIIHIYEGLSTKATGPKYDFTGLSSVAEIMDFLEAQPDNTPETPYTVILNGLNLERDTLDHYDPLAKIMEVLGGKYVSLDLSGCTGTYLQDTWGYDNSTPNKDKVVSIKLPETITELRGYNFRYYTSLTDITMPGIVSIGSAVFEGCTSLESIEFPQSLTQIGSNAFAGCSALVDVYLPASVESIAGSPFPDNTELTFRVDGEGPTSTLENGAILICDSKIIEYNTPKTGAIVIPHGITGINERLFSGAAITSVELPDTLTSISNSTFEYCDSLGSIEFPASLKDIGAGAFRGCTSIETVDLSGTGLTILSGSVFNGCTALETVILPAGLTTFGNTDYDYGYQGVFQGCTSLTSINLEDTQLTNIGERAFAGCLSLTSDTLILPETITTIERGAFQGCELITTMQLPGTITAIYGGSDYAGGGAFKGCTGLTELDLSMTQITIIGDQTFSGCSSLEKVILPEGLQAIGEEDYFSESGVFENCTVLASIDLPSSLTSIDKNAFAGCTSLAVLISRNTTPPALGENALYDTGALIYVPDTGVSAYQAEDGWSEYADRIKGLSELL
jgi:Leucine-rich repeat (LRR) protein